LRQRPGEGCRVQGGSPARAVRKRTQDWQDLRPTRAKRDKHSDDAPNRLLNPARLFAQAANLRAHCRAALGTALDMQRQLLALARMEFTVTPDFLAAKRFTMSGVSAYVTKLAI
jgi:hypothetical protein